MDQALRKLVLRLPPPAPLPGTDVDWERLEHLIGLNYPESFKEFVQTYGDCVWFDNAAPLYSRARSDVEAKEFLRQVSRNLAPLRGNMYDDDFSKISMPLYPEIGGLFPFMVDYGSNLFCWHTTSNHTCLPSLRA